MINYRTLNYGQLGIEQVVALEVMPVAQVDLMTRSLEHAASLTWALGVEPFRFVRGKEILHAFPRVPAVPVRQWLEDHGLEFEVARDKLRGNGQETWVQAGFPA